MLPFSCPAGVIAGWMRCREVEGRESNKGELLAAAANAQNLLDRHGAEIDALTFELNKADEIAAEREKEFITAKDAASALRARLANARYALHPCQACSQSLHWLAS